MVINADVGVMECEMSSSSEPMQLGRLCLSPSQIPTLFNSGQGQWEILLSE